MQPTSSFPTVTDQFCGCGGSSLGAELSGAEIWHAMNHWKLAGDTYSTNHPNVRVDITDVSATDPRRYRSTDILITSPECTNHSLAKGNKRSFYKQDLFGNVLVAADEERSRATMWDVPRFAEYHNYRIIIVENVVEAAKWVLYESWLHAMNSLGYDHEIVYFNSMFAHPTPQSRDRFYGVFWKRGNKKPNLDFRPVAQCNHCGQITGAKQTWKKTKKWGRYGRQYYYMCMGCYREVTPFYFAAFNLIDWSIPAERIGDRKRPLKEKTMARVRYGFDAFGRKPIIVTNRYSSGLGFRAKDATQEPLPTQPGDASHAIVLPWMVETQFSHSGDNRVSGLDDAVSTQSARQSIGIAGFLSKQYGGNADPRAMGIGLDSPSGTVTTDDHHALLTPGFMVTQNGIDKSSLASRSRAVDEPTGTIVSNDNHAFVGVAPYLIKTIRQDNDDVGISSLDPMRTQTTSQDMALIAPSFIAENHGTSKASGLDDALMCVAAGGNHHALISSKAFLTYYYGNSKAGPITDPLGTVTALDKVGLVQALEKMTVEDLTFRMLAPHEIGAAMAFPSTYKVLGTKKEQVRQFGNAVTPPVMTMIIQRCIESLA
jgi:DNA (cytosine-5)-methyltransferase 1